LTGFADREALVFGSTARGTSHALSDVDVAIGTSEDATLNTLDVGELTGRLETAARRAVHLVILNDAPPGLACVYDIAAEGLGDLSPFAKRWPRACASLARARAVQGLINPVTIPSVSVPLGGTCRRTTARQ
jgi:predicted nucleotidyltransferase